ncbi:uncharacterized protein LOC133783773 [Humulus lupulus]|uniref:uncharacterized protein LOC133783773 n=1 Tax=Humulus lupulus TaxID=3486 RepID=UPI002B41734F|nr:uncharacterized protein LOC133783773 [Humulus lupulus]
MVKMDNDVVELDRYLHSLSLKDRKEFMAMLIREGMRGDWVAVVELYGRYPVAHVTKISKSGYTALHVAVSDGKEDVVKKLVELIKLVDERIPPQQIKMEDDDDDDEDKRILPLRMKNEHGSTPLHIAASMGSVTMCRSIIEGSYDGDKLVEIENNDGETPLFLTAFHGKKQAFLYLDHVINRRYRSTEEGTEAAMRCCRRNNGDTVLHCAVSAEYMDMAFQISKQYKNMTCSVNEHGVTPLHLLAEKPSAFKSGANFGKFKSILYDGIKVKRPKVETYRKAQQKDTDDHHTYYTQNYTTMVNCFNILWKFAWTAIRCTRSAKEADPEEPIKNDEGDQIESDNNKTEMSADPQVEDDQDHMNKDKDKPSDGNEDHGRNQCIDVPKKIMTNLIMHFTQLLGFSFGLRDMIKLKEKHICSHQVLNELLQYDSYANEDPGESPHAENEIYNLPENHEPVLPKRQEKKDTAVLIASRNGITEMVGEIIKRFPLAIYDKTKDKKNIVLVALENRKADVYKLLLRTHPQNQSLFWKLDENLNSALHVAAKWNQKRPNPWRIPGDALQLLWEIKWFKFVEDSMPQEFDVRFNKDNQTAGELFTEEHKILVEKGGEWMRKTAEACSVVSTLIATVAFASSTTLPGGNNSFGQPVLEKAPAFKVFAVASLVALSFSITSLVMFLAILTSRLSERDFGRSLPWKLLVGLTSLFVSITAMLVSFCAGHFFVLRNSVKVAAFPIYAVTCIPVTFFAAAQLPLYVDLVRATFSNPFGNAKHILDSSLNKDRSKR